MGLLCPHHKRISAMFKYNPNSESPAAGAGISPMRRNYGPSLKPGPAALRERESMAGGLCSFRGWAARYNLANIRNGYGARPTAVLQYSG